jgi:four helix bundle protein
MGNFKKLQVWQLAKELTVKIYKETNSGPLGKDFNLRDQIRRAAISIPSNIAEGDELDTDKQSIRHFYIAKGSTAELITQLIIANEIGFLKKEVTEPLINESHIISRMLYKLIESRSRE